MLQKVSKRIAMELIQIEPGKSWGVEYTEYRVHCIFCKVVSYSVIITIAGFTGFIIQILVFLGVFIPVRKLSGGYHFNSFIGCLLASVLLCSSSVLFARILPSTWDTPLTIAQTVFAFLYIWKYAPMNTQYFTFSESERMVTKKWVHRCLLVLTVIILALVSTETAYSFIASYALLAVSVLLLFSKSSSREVT